MSRSPQVPGETQKEKGDDGYEQQNEELRVCGWAQESDSHH